MAMMEPVQVGMKQRDGPLVKRIRHRRPLFFSSSGRIGMPCFSLMVKRNGACQHAGNEGLHAQKLGGSFPKYMLLSALSRKENGHPLPNGQHKTRCLSCDAREIYRKAMPSPIAGMDLTYGLPSVGRRAEILYIMVLFFLKFYHKLLFV